MANPDKKRKWSAAAEDVDSTVQFTVGGTGAVGTVFGSTLFYDPIVSTVTRQGVGYYRVTLKELWYRLKEVDGTILQTSFATTNAAAIIPFADGVNDATKLYFEVKCVRNDTGAVAEAASGDIIRINFALNNLNPRIFGY